MKFRISIAKTVLLLQNASLLRSTLHIMNQTVIHHNIFVLGLYFELRMQWLGFWMYWTEDHKDNGYAV